ncbi:MAG: DUF3040 domain-containing protein [Actinomycetota bacterium]
MPLSEHEQRILDEIERRLAAEDPKFARSATLATPRGVAVRRIKRAFAGLVLGLGLLIAGLIAGLNDPNLLFALGLSGFAVMLFFIVSMMKASKTLGASSAMSASDHHNPSWFSRAEERWRKRFERGDER